MVTFGKSFSWNPARSNKVENKITEELNVSNLIVGKGSCLCGAVTISANTMSNKVEACHCTMCQKWTGGPLMVVDCGVDVSIQGEENVTVFNSSEWAERGFCKKCGSNLFYRLRQDNKYLFPVGLFDGAEGLIFDRQIFIDEKPEYYCFANKTHNMTGAEVFAMHAPSNDS
jgi:hypothetical protein